jgi:two-component system sensor histidine kinase DesK
MKGQIGERPSAPTTRNARAILLVRILAVVSLVPLVTPAASLWFQSKLGIPAPPARGLGGGPAWVEPLFIALVMALYLLYWLRLWPNRAKAPIAAVLIGMGALATAGEVLGAAPGVELWLYVAVVVGAAMRIRWAAVVVIVMAVGALVPILFLLPASPGVPGQSGSPEKTPNLWLPAVMNVSQLTIAALGGALVTFLMRTNAELHAARAAFAQLAVQEERTRLARDLHDLLGHNLLLMAARLELARKLIGQPDHPAAAEVREIQRLARNALHEVREVVGGFRQPTLEGELAGAAVALEAAGIGLELRDSHGVLTPSLEAACAWLVREGTTNVLKHSGARTCRIEVNRENGGLDVRITDDGTGGSPNGAGMGLQGLTERIAALGGTLTAGSGPSGGGFQLAAHLPVASLEGKDGTN